MFGVNPECPDFLATGAPAKRAEEARALLTPTDPIEGA
jgi:hypothetical protein